MTRSQINELFELPSFKTMRISKRTDGKLDVSIQNPIETSGHTCHVAENGYEALEWLLSVSGSHPHHRQKNGSLDKPEPIMHASLEDLI